MAGTRTSRVTSGYGTASDENGNNIEGPQDASDILGIESEIGGRRGTAPRRSPLGGIDLNKGLDLKKPRAPRSGIGIDIGKSETGNLGIGVEIPIPVPAPISARGKVAIDPATGKIRGGGLGIGLGKGPIGISVDIGVDTPPGSDKFGCFKYVTVSVSIFSHTFGKNECEPTPSIPAPLIPAPTPGPANIGYTIDKMPPLREECIYHFLMIFIPETREYYNQLPPTYQSDDRWERIIVTPNVGDVTIVGVTPAYAVITNGEGVFYEGSPPVWQVDKLPEYRKKVIFSRNGNRMNPSQFRSYFQSYYMRVYAGQKYFITYVLVSCNGVPQPFVAPSPLSSSPPSSSPPSSSPRIPNPQPTKKKMDDACCKRVEALQLETLRMLGRQIVGGKLVPVGMAKGFLGEETERIKTPIKNAKKPEKIKIRFNTLYEMLVYELKQANNLDTALDPQSYKPPEGCLQNPEYSRDVEVSLTNNKQPGADKSGNKREFKINVDDEAKFSGFIQQQSYVFEAIKRLEYLFPFGELSDALIAKNLLIPGAEGDIKIHNMIMAYEIMMQYINATLGNPREVLTIKNANPAIDGDQPIEVKALTVSDWMRQVVKFQIDTGGDVDATVNLMLRDFRTNLANRTDIVKTSEMVQALFEDSGMLEKQEYIPLHLEGDPYAGQWVKGKGFKANPDLEKKTEEATEKVLRETMKPTDIKIKVSRRSKEEKTDMRDLLRGLADFTQRLLSVPSGGDAAKSIDKLIESAKFKVQTDMALIRQNVSKAAAASRNRTKKRKK